MTNADTFKAWWGRQGRWSRRSWWGLAGLLVCWALAWALVPPLLRWQLQVQASEILGRAVTVEQVRFSPWSLELEITGLAVAGTDPSGPPQVQARRIYIDAELQSLLRLAPVLDAVELEAPQVRLRHLGDGRYDIDDVLKRLAERPQTPDERPARFALYNLRLSDGGVVFEDVPVATTHRLEGLALAVPFLSNLSSQRDVVTQPRLAFTLNGSAFDSQAQTTPFAEDHATQARLAIKDFDLAPYLGYWPAALPVKPAGGRLQADLSVAFEQRDSGAAVKIDGELALENARLLTRDGAELLVWERLGLRLADTRPLDRHVGLQRIDWVAPGLALGRSADGQINLQRLLAPKPPGQSATPDTTRSPTNPAPAWTVAVGEFHLQRGRLGWLDQTLRPAFATALEGVDLKVGAIQWPVKAPMPVALSLHRQRASVQLQGQASDREAQFELELRDLALSDAEPYLRERLTLPLKGQLSATARVGWRAGDDPENGVRVALSELVLADLWLGEARAPQAAWRQLRVSEAQLDLNARRLSLGRVALERPQLNVSRDGQGHWMVQQWWRAPTASAQPVVDTAPEATGPAWALGWTALALQGGTVRLDDRANTKPARLELANLSFSAGPWRSDTAGRTPLTLDTRVAAPGASRADPGRLQLQGPLTWKPSRPQPDIGASLRVLATALPAHVLEPYVSERLNLELLRADAGYRGQLDLGMGADGLRLALGGDVALDEFRANTLSPSEELLAWKTLNLRGLQLAMAPGQPLRLQVAETALSDWYARIAIDETGRINLQDLVKPAPVDPTAPASAPPATAGPAPELRFGPVALVKGRVLFSDRFIKPNYSANLSELTGKLSAFSNQPASPGAPVALADLELLGRVEGTASLVLTGRINPLAQPLALDVKGQVRDLELPPLSPYTVKYAGYGIERGKLSVDVTYKISPDGRLEASNQIVLNQLTFGERVAGSEAPNLPVKLAVALLADRNGVIDINLPISGSMNDPEFRLGPVIVKVIFNLIGKAITAPFALLANAFGGGGEENSQVTFAPGSARLDAAARERLDGVAKALADRPALRLTVVGSSDLERERVAYQRERVNEWVRAEKRRLLARGGAAADGEVVVSEAEYPVLLKEVYRRADIAKPRNVIGMAKDLPVAEMEALLMTSVPVTADTMRELALQRSVAVRDHLAARQLPTERLFTGAPRTAAAGSAGASDTTPRAELQLTAR